MSDSRLISWFELPSKDINRAVKFYNDVLGTNLQIIDFGGMNMAMFTDNPAITGGAIVENEFSFPSNNGTTVYFFVEDVEETINKVEGAGGSILVPKTQISEEYGFYGQFMDTEGNKIGLHSMK